MDGRSPFEFRCVTDGVVYRFEPEAGSPARWKRTGLDLWCEFHHGRGWAIADSTGTVLGWPLSSDGDEDVPPAGRWRSQKGEKSYEYELVWLA